MQWLDQLPFADNRVVQMGFLAACGIAALVVLAILYRLVFAHRLRVPGGRTRQPRLGLVDAFSLDGQRQLVLVRRDNVEHLVMIGGPNDVLVELQINRALTPARENNQASPLLAPGASGRRTETPLAAAPVVAEAPPSKVAAPAATSAPAAPKAPAPAPAPAAPKAPAPVPVPAPVQPPGPAARPQPPLRPRPLPRPRPNQSNRSPAPGSRSGRGRAIGGARPAGAGEFAVAASCAGAFDNASADRSRERLRQSGDRDPPDGEGRPEIVADPRQSAGPFRGCAFAAARGEGRNLPPRRSPRSRSPGRRGRRRGVCVGARRRRGRHRPRARRNSAKFVSSATNRTQLQAPKGRRRSTIRSPTSIRSKRKWRACSAAKS